MTDAEKLIALYTRAGERLLDLIRSLEDGNFSRRRKERLLKEVDVILAGLTDGAAQSMSELLAMAYKEGVSEAVDSILAQGVPDERINTVLEPLIHQQAVQAIMDDSFFRILEATDNMSQDAKRRIEEVTRTATERMLTEGVNRRQATKEAVASMTEQGITGIVAKNGARIPADKYMNGVVQYNLRKAHVTGAENTIKQNGLDLIYVNFVGITCEYCAKYQGRVYSISGADPRFPKLEIRPPYHAHCIHSISAWIEEYQPADEVERMLAASNRPFTDNRTEANIRRYNEIQREKARLNEDRKQWARYRVVVPEETPKSMAAFRRMKYNDSDSWRQLQSDYRKLNAYNKIIAKEPVITADLKQISEATGVEMVGLEFRIKSKSSYLRKISADSGESLDLQAISDAISGTGDVIRYTYQSAPTKLVDDYLAVNRELSEKGYDQIKLKNTWLIKANPYKGINANYRSSDGQKFEVQFHTPESFDLKNGELHILYENWRVIPNKADPEAVRLSKLMSEMSRNLRVPDRIEEVK